MIMRKRLKLKRNGWSQITWFESVSVEFSPSPVSTRRGQINEQFLVTEYRLGIYGIH